MRTPNYLLFRRPSTRFLMMSGLILVSAHLAHAGSATWNGGGTLWSNGPSWSTSSAPGATSGTTNTDTATFNTSSNDSITVDTGRNIGSITFDGNVGSETFSGGTLLLTAGGTAQLTSTVSSTSQVETFSTPITIEGGYTFANNSAGNTFNIGAVALNSAATATLNLAGSNTGANTISGNLIDKSGTIKLAVIKSGGGTWVLTGANTYTGTTTISGGTLQVNSATGSIGTSTTINLTGGRLLYNSTDSSTHTQTTGPVNITTGASTVESDESGGGSSTLALGTLSRTQGATLNIVTSGTGASVTNSTSSAVGASAVGNGVFYNGADFAAATANGTFGASSYTTVANAGTVTAANATYFLLQGNASGTSLGNSSGIKFGANNSTYTVNNAASTFSAILVTGGFSETVAGSGTQAAIRTSTGGGELVVRTDTSADTLTISAPIVSVSNSGALTKTGAGLLKLTGTNTYAGNTYIDQGTLQTTSASGLGFGGASGGPNANGVGPVGTTSVASGATLDLHPSATMTVNEPIILNGGTLTNNGTGTATIDNGVAGIQVTTASAGTATGATITIGNTGTSQATATASVTSGVLTSTTITSVGSGYTSAPSVSVTFTGGTETTQPVATAILSSVTLNGTSNTIGSGTGSLIINAAIADGTSSGGFTKSGSGGLTLTGSNTFSGGTTVTGGMLLLTNTAGSATGTGALSVGAGATLAGTGASSGTGFNISGTGTATASRANVLVGQTSLTDTNTTQVLTLKGSGASTIVNAKLTFNLDVNTPGAYGSDPAGSGNELSVGNSAITLGSGVQSTVFALNLQNTGIVALNTPYVLVAGNLGVNGVGTGVNGSQYFGLNLGTPSAVVGGGTMTQILNSGDNNLAGNLILSLTGISEQFYGANSYLFLYQNSATGADDIEVEVVPEPSTWALIAGGLLTLFYVQRRKQRRNPDA